MAKTKTRKPKPMKKFLVTYHMNAKARKAAERVAKEGGPEAMEAGMKRWMDWAAKCGDQLVEMGAPLGGSVKLDSAGVAGTSRRGIAGYSILQAKSIAGAKKLCKKHPHLTWVDEGCELEIHEMQPM